MQRSSVLPTTESEALRRQRRTFGILLGTLLGFTYTLVSQGVNLIALPDVPLYQPPFGFLGNVAFGAVWGAVLGLLCTLPDSTTAGIVIASIASVFMTVIRSLIGVSESAFELIIVGLVLGIPAAVIMSPVMTALRWMANTQVELRKQAFFTKARARGPLTLLLLTAFLAVFSLYNTTARTLLVRMNQDIQRSLAAVRLDELAAEFQRLREGDFLRDASKAYTLEWTESDLDRFIDLRPANNYEDHSAIITRFNNTRTMVCLYPTVDSRPNCAFRPVGGERPSLNSLFGG
ncbi:MAG: hypothetical protein WAZ19_07805 [Anaerolineae bacterium]